jgi:hypothetical protein
MPKGIYIRTEKTRQILSKSAIGKHIGEKNGHWKGDKIGYVGLHDWVKSKLGKPNLCEHCRKTEGKFQWANKSGKYKRELTDWIRLCIPCHLKYDNHHKKMWITRRSKLINVKIGK